MKFSVIDDKLTIYQDKKVILWGAGGSARYVYEFLKSKNVNIVAFCDNDSQKWGGVLCNLEIISPEKFQKMYSNLEDVLIQVATQYEDEIIPQLKEMGVTNFVSYGEAFLRFTRLDQYNFFKRFPEKYPYFLENVYSKKDQAYYQIWNSLFSSHAASQDVCVLLCMPPKTGDMTMLYTLHEACIHGTNLWHTTRNLTPEIMSVIKNKKIKLITAVRDPIAQNISWIYHSASESYWDRWEYWHEGGDAWKLLEMAIREEVARKNNNPIDKGYISGSKRGIDARTTLIQHYFEIEYQKGLGVNLFNYEFDKEKGYGIVKWENFEIFIYQLEKLNFIYKDLLQFLECGFTENVKLINGNVAEDKWYKKYYQDALKEIKFPKKYFDWSYASPYVKHFYSQKDIEIFKDRWKNHVI